MAKTLGIVGGLGTETSCSFCFKVNSRIKKNHQAQPHIILDNIPVPRETENSIIRGDSHSEFLELLNASVQRLNQLQVDFLVIPCNTAHTFIDNLRKNSQADILSIIEETAKECVKLSIKKVGLLASSKTINEKLHSKELNKQNIEVILPNIEEQEFISESIIRILNESSSLDDPKKILEVIKGLEKGGAQAIILGCSDLFQLISQEDVALPLIDTTSVLENAVVERIGPEKDAD